MRRTAGGLRGENYAPTNLFIRKDVKALFKGLAQDCRVDFAEALERVMIDAINKNKIPGVHIERLELQREVEKDEIPSKSRRSIEPSEAPTSKQPGRFRLAGSEQNQESKNQKQPDPA